MKTTLFYVPGMDVENRAAEESLRRIPGMKLEKMKCDPSMRRMHRCPFVTNEDTKDTYYGRESIGRFADRALANLGKVRVALFCVPEMKAENAAAEKALRRLPGLSLEVVECHPTMRRLYVCPFAMDEATKTRYYGGDEIAYFVECVLSPQKRKRT